MPIVYYGLLVERATIILLTPGEKCIYGNTDYICKMPLMFKVLLTKCVIYLIYVTDLRCYLPLLHYWLLCQLRFFKLLTHGCKMPSLLTPGVKCLQYITDNECKVPIICNWLNSYSALLCSLQVSIATITLLIQGSWHFLGEWILCRGMQVRGRSNIPSNIWILYSFTYWLFFLFRFTAFFWPDQK